MANGLTRNLKAKVCRRTLRNRLKDKGYVPSRKIEKSDFLKEQCVRRCGFGQAHSHRTGPMWSNHLQGCGDMKDVIFYPRRLKARFTRYRCPWTYMTQCEKYKKEFLRPKKQTRFSRKEYKLVKNVKILGFTASAGKQLFVKCRSCHTTIACF